MTYMPMTPSWPLPKLSHIVDRDGVLYMYFYPGGNLMPIDGDSRVAWVGCGWPHDDPETWGWNCWSTTDDAVALEYTLRYA